MKKRPLEGNMTPVEALIHIYNVLIILYLIIFISDIRESAILLVLHIAGAAAYVFFQFSRNRHASPLLQIWTVWIPIILLSAFHYETGLLNRIIFPNFLDDLVINADSALFGFAPYLLFREKYPSELIAQLSHFFYASFYILLVAPLTLLFIRERKSSGSAKSPGEFWRGANRLKEMQFVLMLTMLNCFIIFIIFPVKGPTGYHSVLFPEPRGMVAIMNYLFSNGDLDGGAMPSSHVAGALVVVIYTFKYLRRWFWAALGLLIPLAISTVYNSYHYATDVIAGLIAGWLFYLAGRAILKAVGFLLPFEDLK
jgi:membrane-associated phospholipid phosphatase